MNLKATLPAALAIAENDLTCYAKNRMAIFWTFVGPALCMWCFGFLTPPANGLASVTVINRDPHSTIALNLINALRHNGHFVTEADRPPKSALSVEVAPTGVMLHTDAGESEAERSLRYEVQAELLTYDTAPTIVKFSDKPAPTTSGFQRTVPAYLIMFLTMNLLMSGAGFSEERASGRIRRLLIAPLSSLSVIAGRLASRLVVAWLQMLVLFAIGVFVLQIHWAAHAGGVVLLLSLYVLAMGSVGILLGTCLHDPDQASAVAMWGALILAPLTGLWWPIELMPAAFQTVARCLPTGWVMHGVDMMLATGASPGDFTVTFLGLLAVAAVAISISARRLAAA